MAVRTTLGPFTIPIAVGTSSTPFDVSGVTEDVRCAPDSTATASGANACTVALFSCDDLTIGASTNLVFNAASPATWPNSGIGVHYLGSIVGGPEVLNGTPKTLLTSAGFQPLGWGAGLIILRTAGTSAQNLEVNGIGTANGSSSVLVPFVAIADVAAGGNIGTAATTVNISSAFLVTQTTAGQTLTLPAPTATSALRLAYVNNTGSTTFFMYGQIVPRGAGVLYAWNGTVWGVQGASLLPFSVLASGLVGLNQTTPLARLDVAGAIILEPPADITDGTGTLGTAAATVDVASVLHVNQTTPVVLYANMRLIAAPTSTAGKGRKLTIVNVGTAAFIVGDAVQKQGINLIPGSVPGVNGASASKGQACAFEWNGTCWVPEDTGIGVGVVAAGLADGSASIPRAGRYTIYRAAAWTQNGTLTASITGALIGDVIDVVRDDGSAANTMTVNNIAAAALVVAPASKKATIRITYQSTDWQLLGGGAF